MRSIIQFDEERARRVEAYSMISQGIRLRGEALRLLALRSGERALDIGSGPGFLAAEMGVAVGPSGHVWGIDNSPEMIALAQKRCAGWPWVEFQQGDATRLPFSDEALEVAASTYVYEYVRDIDKALEEVHRVLRPGGRLLISETDWKSIAWHTTDQARMDRILSAFDEHCYHPSLPRSLASKLKNAGFLLQRREGFVQFNPEYDANTYGGRLIDGIVSFVAGRQGVTQEEADAWAEDLRKLGERGEYFFSINVYIFLAVKP